MAMSNFLKNAIAHHIKSNGGYVMAKRRHRFNTEILAKKSMETQNANASEEEPDSDDDETSTAGDKNIPMRGRSMKVADSPEDQEGGEDSQVKLRGKAFPNASARSAGGPISKVTPPGGGMGSGSEAPHGFGQSVPPGGIGGNRPEIPHGFGQSVPPPGAGGSGSGEPLGLKPMFPQGAGVSMPAHSFSQFRAMSGRGRRRR